MAVSAITDFRIQVSLFTNRKFRRLRSALGPGACMALVELWGYAATNEPDGALLGWSSDDVEVAANWDGIRGVFTQHLVDLHWLDPAEGGGYLIHDWAENQPWIADAPKRSAHAKKAIDTRWARERARREADGNDQNTAGIPAEYSENTPFLSSPLLPSPPPPTPPTPRKRGVRVATKKSDGGKFAEIFPGFYAAYPRKRAVDDARKAWGQVIQTDADLALVRRALPVAIRLWSRDGVADRHIPYPASWLRSGDWRTLGLPPSEPAESLQDREDREWKDALLKPVRDREAGNA